MPRVGPNSFTSDDVVELHIHSGRAVISSVLDALARLSRTGSSQLARSKDVRPLGLRPAEHGEFTRRAYEGGRIDITQAEAIHDLVNAQTETQRRLALDSAKVCDVCPRVNYL